MEKPRIGTGSDGIQNSDGVDIREGYFELKRGAREFASARQVVDTLLDDVALTAARRVYPKLLEWAKQYPIILPNRLISMCLDNAAMCPRSSSRTILQASVVCLVIFAVDDLVDGAIGALSDEQAHALLQLCIAITDSKGACNLTPPIAVATMGSSEPSDPWVQVVRAHAELCKDLAAAPEAGYAIFAEYFNACMHEMRTELVWRRAFIEHDVVPRWEEYMHAGERSLGAPAVWGSVIALDEYPMDTSLPVGGFSSLKALCDAIVYAGGRCLRVANDARSFSREIHFENKPNSILTLMRHEGMSEDAAESLVLERREAYHAEMLALLGSLPAPLFEWGQAVRRFCDFTKTWYVMTELHDAPEEMKRLLDAVSTPNTDSIEQ